MPDGRTIGGKAFPFVLVEASPKLMICPAHADNGDYREPARPEQTSIGHRAVTRQDNQDKQQSEGPDANHLRTQRVYFSHCFLSQY